MQKAEGRKQKAERGPKGRRGGSNSQFSILNSAFCILHSAFRFIPRRVHLRPRRLFFPALLLRRCVLFLATGGRGEATTTGAGFGAFASSVSRCERSLICLPWLSPSRRRAATSLASF